MKAIMNITSAPREEWIIENLPDDLMCYPIYPISINESGYNICRSETTGKYYVTTYHHSEETDDPFSDLYNVCTACLDVGSWLDIIPVWSDGNHFAYAPFPWGVPVPCKYSNEVQYLPIWESVPSGKYDYEGFAIYHHVYKLIRLCPDTSKLSDNYVQSNYSTSFEVIDYGENMVQLVEDMQCYTGIKY